MEVIARQHQRYSDGTQLCLRVSKLLATAHSWRCCAPCARTQGDKPLLASVQEEAGDAGFMSKASQLLSMTRVKTLLRGAQDSPRHGAPVLHGAAAPLAASRRMCCANRCERVGRHRRASSSLLGSTFLAGHNLHRGGREAAPCLGGTCLGIRR